MAQQRSDASKPEKAWMRALYALPLLPVVYLAHRTMGKSITSMVLLPERPGRLNIGQGIVIDMYLKYFGVPKLDQFIGKFVGLFTPAIGGFDPIARLQGIAFLGDLIPVQTIWMIEGIRRGNAMTAADLLPAIFGVLFQIRGIGYIGPIYYFLHYIQSPLKKYAAADNRSVQLGAAKAIIPTIAISYIVPSFGMFLAPGLANRQWINGLFWQAFPVYASIAQRVFGLFLKDATQTERIKNPTADLPYLRNAYGFAAMSAAFAYTYVRFTSPVPMFEVLFGGLADPSKAAPLIEQAGRILRYDYISCFSAGAYWTLLSFSDLKEAGKLQAGWAKIVGIFAGVTLAFGPGAGMATMWAWREEVLAQRVVVKEKN